MSNGDNILTRAQRLVELSDKATHAPMVAEAIGSEGYQLRTKVDGSTYRDHYEQLGFRGEIGEIRGGRDWQELRANAELCAAGFSDGPAIAQALVDMSHILYRLASTVNRVCGDSEEFDDSEFDMIAPHVEAAFDLLNRLRDDAKMGADADE